MAVHRRFVRTSEGFAKDFPEKPPYRESMGAPIVLDRNGIYGLKPRFQNVLRPLVGVLAGAGVRANHVTIAGAALSIVCGAALLVLDQPRAFVVLGPVWLMRMALNAIDGMLAREFAQASPLGAYLNELGDVVSDVALILPFAHVAGFSPFWIWIVAVSAVVTELAGVVAVTAGARRRYDGPLGKSDRAVVLGALGLWVGIAGGVPPAVASMLPPVLAALLALTVIQRVRGGVREAKRIGR
jgi:CDP-diacylglycerol---glycerol-3-phosphate 3-phosphatidyltransferase